MENKTLRQLETEMELLQDKARENRDTEPYEMSDYLEDAEAERYYDLKDEVYNRVNGIKEIN